MLHAHARALTRGWAYRLGARLERHAGVRITRTPGPSATTATATTAGRAAKVTAARPPADPRADRLLVAPVFVLSAPRSGSTLLRVVLGSHSQLHAPIETHVRRLAVRFTTRLTRTAMDTLGHSVSDVEHILWDRMLHRELLRSGKRTVVEKTPSNVFAAERFALCWPDARFVFLLRHPLSIARSWHEADPIARPMSRAIPHTLKYMAALDRARRQLPGLTVRYEDLTADPTAETRRICDYLGITWEPGMIAYGRQDHGEFRKGTGDWREKIRSGTIQPGRALPSDEEIPAELREMCRRWGYGPDPAPAPSAC
jgi:sulfotransferase family protein